jgi:hypothetical protein
MVRLSSPCGVIASTTVVPSATEAPAASVFGESSPVSSHVAAIKLKKRAEAYHRAAFE